MRKCQIKLRWVGTVRCSFSLLMFEFESSPSHWPEYMDNLLYEGSIYHAGTSISPELSGHSNLYLYNPLNFIKKKKKSESIRSIQQKKTCTNMAYKVGSETVICLFTNSPQTNFNYSSWKTMHFIKVVRYRS